MFGLTTFLPSFLLNVAQNKDPLESVKNATIDSTLSGVAGHFGSAMPSFGSVQNAEFVPSLLQSNQPTSMMSTLASQPYAGPTSMMQNLPTYASDVVPEMTNTITQSGKIMPSYMDTTGLSYDQIAQIEGPGGFEPYVTTGRTTNLAPLTERTDVAQTGPFNIGPDMSQVTAPDPQDLAKAGGYEEAPLYKRATDKIIDYVKDKPLESTFMAATIGGSLYEGFKPKQTQTVQAPLGPQLGGKSFSGGGDQILKVRRPR